MPEATTAWMVQLELSTDDVEGILVLDDEALRFTGLDGRARRIPLLEVGKIKRVMGSPVIVIHSVEDGTRRHTAFYFRKPPPLHPQEPSPDEPPQTLIGPFNRNRGTSRRKQRRANATYLATASTTAYDEVREWQSALRAAVAAAKGRR